MVDSDLAELLYFAKSTMEDAGGWETDVGDDDALEPAIEEALNQIGDWASTLYDAVKVYVDAAKELGNE